jgi:hypothetical protein
MQSRKLMRVGMNSNQLKMKQKLFIFIFSVLSFLPITSCNNQSGQSKAGNLNSETKNSNKMNEAQLTNFGKKYSEAWCSQKPESVAAFFATNGSLKVNADSPAVGREAITKVAQGFMTAFPDMVVAMDSLVTKSNGIEFHWTLTGTNSGTGGTGNKIKVSGFEVWTLSENELIQESIGSFDADEYNRQLKEGVK